MLVNENLPAWYKRNSPANATITAIGTARTSNGLDPREILLAERDGKFSLLDFLRSQTELCRVLVRATNFPYLKRYAPLVLKNPRADQEGIAGYEMALNYNGVAFALMPRAASEIKGAAKNPTAVRKRSGIRRASLPQAGGAARQPLAVDRRGSPGSRIVGGMTATRCGARAPLPRPRVCTVPLLFLTCSHGEIALTCFR